MNNYQIFLNKINVISEKEFNNILKEFPTLTDEDIPEINFDMEYYYNDVRKCIADYLITEISNKGFVDEITSDKIYIYDLESLEELEECKKVFSSFEFVNYDELKEEIVEELEENKQYNEYESLIQEIRDNYTLKQLKKLLKKYDR